MKKLLAALVITLGTVAAAEQKPSPAPTQAQQEQERLEGKRVKTGVDASEVGPKIKDAAKDTKDAVGTAAKDTKEGAVNAADKVRDAVGIDTAKQGTFKKDKAFSMSGTLKGTGGGGVTVVRPGLPNADLDVRDETVVSLDGKKVAASDIPEGSSVLAKFQIEGEEAVAVELRATSPKAVKPTK